MDFEQPIGNVNPVIRVDADQAGVEGRGWILVSGSPFETIGCPNCSFASMPI